MLGIILGIIGIIGAFFLTYLFGIPGGAVCLILGAVAVILGFRRRAKNEGRGGIGAIVIGSLAVIAAVAMSISSIKFMETIRDKAKESGVAPLFAQYTENTYLGITGVFLNIPQDEAKIKELMDELELLNKMEPTKTEETK